MNTFFEIYEPSVTVVDKDRKHTAVRGERCLLDSIVIVEKKPFVRLLNSQDNELYIPYEIFKDVFYPSKNQINKKNKYYGAI